MSGCGLAPDPPIGGNIVDPPLSGSLPADPPATGAVVADTVIDVVLGAGQGMAGAPGATGATGPTGATGATGAAGATPVEHSYSIAVSVGQTVIPISPPPADLNGLVLLVNGVAYAPPSRIAVSAVAVTWLGEFALDPSDDVRVTYF